MLKYLLIFSGTCVACLVLVASVNYLVDVNGVYHEARRARAAEEYVSALRAAPAGLVFNPYERSVKLMLLRATRADCYITGSSHEMQLALSNFAPAARCGQLINLAVSGASYEDLITQMGALAEHPAVHTVFIGIGPWMLRPGADHSWTEERGALRSACTSLGIPADSYRESWVDRARLARNAVSGEYLSRNLEVLANPQPPIRPAAQRGAADPMMRSDGSFQYSRQFLAATPPPPDAVGDGSYKIAQPYVDPTVVEGLYSGLTALTRKGVHVVFVFMPYHPHVMACQNGAVCAAMGAVERAINYLAQRVGADTVGSYDPRRSSLDWRDFYDDMHISTQALGKLKW